MIQLQDIGISRAGRTLLQGVNLRIHPKQIIGLVGQNGSGKSSLLSMLRGELEPDRGSYDKPQDWRIASVAQETPALEQSALAYVLQGHEAYQSALAELEASEQSGDGLRIAAAHEQFHALNGYAQSALASELLSGLGFSMEAQKQAVKSFSGGWRMRLNLAQALIAPCELLLLDEPTNHLDLDAIIWLQDYLKQHPATKIIIAHDRDFLDELCTHIVHLENQSALNYTGNYSDFERLRHEQRAQSEALYQKEQVRKAELERFINRFRAKATKAKQAQSRMKALEKLQASPPPPPEHQYELAFKAPKHTPDPHLTVSDGELGYGETVVLSKLKFRLGGHDRIGLLGRNGAGKSTLMKWLAGVLEPKSGSITRHEHSHIGYFTQHQLEALRAEESALWHIKQQNPTAREQELRNFLGGYGFGGERIDTPVGQLSGGEKARLALALIIEKQPNVLLLDEPTNHLDLGMRDALNEALQGFQGAMVLISHDRALLRSTCDDFYLVADGRVKPFDGDLDDYRQYLQQEASQANAQSALAKGEQKSELKAQTKRQEAEERTRLRPYKQAVNKLERELEQCQSALDLVQQRLSDADLYDDAHKAQLKAALDEESALQQKLLALEERYLEALQILEEQSALGA
ncbi:MAG: ATP-binding cassette domain-containing protein [Cardiobacteriaceae bacterium]|nr:ATP-binding cassette domain-containing protein [Cardiobacteriaceae bacterium]